MPTASKLVAAVAFALVAAIAAHLFIPAMPEGTQVKWFREICAFIGFMCGWWVMGRSNGKGYTDAVNMGIVTSVMILFWCLLSFSVYLMVIKSTRMMYDGPMEAVLGVFEFMLDYGKLLVQPATPIALLIGGVLAGCLTEAAGRKWS